MKIRNTVIAAALLAVLPAFSARAVVVINPMADIVFVVDESGSMAGEHGWLGTMVTGFNTNLVTAGVTDAKFGLVGYGGAGAIVNGRTLTNFTSAASFATATGSLVTSGSTEDGYAGIAYALSNLTFRSGAAVNVVLVTDEDRDNNSPNTYAGILAALNAKSALLNVVVNGTFKNSAGTTGLGHDSDTNAYLANGSGGYTFTSPLGTATGAGTTIADYYNMALATGGAAWDLNQLRAGGNTAASFTAAFTAIKVAEIISQPPSTNVPDSGTTIVLLLGSLAAIGGLRRRMMA